MELVRILQEIFSREPPLRSKQNQSRSLLPGKPNSNAPPLPPLPPELGGSSPRFNQSKSTVPSSGPPPPPPPKPFQTRNEQIVTGHDSAPPVPPHPNREPAPYRPNVDHYASGQFQSSQAHSPPTLYRPQRVNSLRNERYPPISPDMNRLPSMTFDPQRGSPNLQLMPLNGSASSANQNPSHQHIHYGQSPLPLPEPSIRPYNWQDRSQIYYQSSNQAHGPPPPGGSHAQTIPKPPEDLLTSSFDTPMPAQSSVANIPAPPIPPNPEKDALLAAVSRTLTQHLHSNIASNAAYLPPLHAQHSALQSAIQRLQQEQQSLNTLSALLTSNEAILRKAMHDADNCIKNVKHRTVPGVDEVLVAPTVVGEQLYKLVAEERACVDVRGMLGRALDKGRIGSEDWVKRARGLGREEFLNRVTIKKCVRGLGLRTDEEWA